MKIISFCLYGDNPLYTEGALINLEYAKIVYPEWKCRFYCDRNSVPPRVLRELEQGGGELILMEDACRELNYAPSLWRMKPFADSSCSHFLVRDTDSRLSFREKAAVDEWIASGKTLHLLHDHKAHVSPVMAGLFGAKGNSLPDFARLLDRYMQSDTYLRFGLDQRFMNRVILPLFAEDYLSHNDMLDQHDSTLRHIRFPVLEKNFLAADQSFVGQTISVQNAMPKPHRA